MDDVFAVVDSEFDYEQFLKALNGQYASIKFTLEKEQNRNLPFLDLMVWIENNKFKSETCYI